MPGRYGAKRRPAPLTPAPNLKSASALQNSQKLQFSRAEGPLGKSSRTFHRIAAKTHYVKSINASHGIIRASRQESKKCTHVSGANVTDVSGRSVRRFKPASKYSQSIISRSFPERRFPFLRPVYDRVEPSASRSCHERGVRPQLRLARSHDPNRLDVRFPLDHCHSASTGRCCRPRAQGRAA